MKIPNKALGIAISFLLCGGSVQAATTLFSTTLSASAEADPTNESTGTGTATFVYDDVLNTLAISVMFSGLTGTTTVSHIHAVTALAFTGNANVATETPSFNLFPTDVTSGTYNNIFDLTLPGSYNAPFLTANGGSTAAAEAALVAAMTDGHAYLNIHTTYRRPGEIRGYISRVPDSSSTVALLIPAMLLGMGIAYRQRRSAA
jgi:hypothetical protein